MHIDVDAVDSPIRPPVKVIIVNLDQDAAGRIEAAADLTVSCHGIPKRVAEWLTARR
jgi:hypothetical protein